MKIKVPPHNSAPQGQTIIIKEQREGCFLQTLNLGCAIFALIVVLLLAALAWAFIIANRARENQSRAPAPRAAKTTQTAATPSAQKPQPKTTDLYFFQESKDAMTDAARYIFAWKSEKSREPFSLIDEAIVLRFSPTQVERSTHKMKYEIECIIHADFSYVGRDKTTATVRFDDKPARAWKCSPSTTGEGLFIDDARGFLSEIAYARRCRVRFDDFGGQQHDLDFNLGFFSLQNFREKIVDCVLKSNPPNVKIVD
jgi:hypothetical protein